MIICDVCMNEAQYGVPALRYVIPLRMLDSSGQFQIPETYSVDLCDRHAGEFRARLIDLVAEYGLKDAAVPADHPLGARPKKKGK